MRMTFKYHKHGDRRTVKKFIWWPMILMLDPPKNGSLERGDVQMRWLEYTYVTQLYLISGKGSHWIDFCWGDAALERALDDL